MLYAGGNLSDGLDEPGSAADLVSRAVEEDDLDDIGVKCSRMEPFRRDCSEKGRRLPWLPPTPPLRFGREYSLVAASCLVGVEVKGGTRFSSSETWEEACVL